MLAATALGAVSLPIDSAMRILIARVTGAPIDAPRWMAAILLDVRMPRVVLGAVAGGGLAVAGASMQGLFRNPMADPGILGVSGGAALGAVLALYLGSHQQAPIAVTLAAFTGALLCAYCVVGLAYRRGRVSTVSLLLAGVAVGTMASALTSLVLSLALSHWEVGREMTSWLMGGLEGRTWQHVMLCSPTVLVSFVALVMHAHELNALATGELGATAVGIDVPALTKRVVLWASLATAATVSVVGVVAFVGLIVPHITRMIVGADHRRLLPASFVLGAIFLVWTDLVCRLVESSHDLRLGVVTSLLGGPFFLFLLIRDNRRNT
jgi:iron complex transport system permease protein